MHVILPFNGHVILSSRYLSFFLFLFGSYKIIRTLCVSECDACCDDNFFGRNSFFYLFYLGAQLKSVYNEKCNLFVGKIAEINRKWRITDRRHTLFGYKRASYDEKKTKNWNIGKSKKKQQKNEEEEKEEKVGKNCQIIRVQSKRFNKTILFIRCIVFVLSFFLFFFFYYFSFGERRFIDETTMWTRDSWNWIYTLTHK